MLVVSRGPRSAWATLTIPRASYTTDRCSNLAQREHRLAVTFCYPGHNAVHQRTGRKRLASVIRSPRLSAAYRQVRPLVGKVRDLKYLEPRASSRQAAALRRCFHDRVTIARAEDEIKRALDTR